MRSLAFLPLAFALVACGGDATPTEASGAADAATTAAVADDAAPTKILGEGGCHKSKGEAVHADAHGHGDEAIAGCACSKDAEATRWCDGCDKGFIDGQPTDDREAVEAALKAGV